jgi:thiol-disulfide isomerase/thioredoxin
VVTNGLDLQQFGEPLRDFALPSLNGTIASLSATLSGKMGAVVVIWSSTCSHCLRYDRYLNEFEQHHPDLSLTVVSARVGESIESALKAASQRKLRFRILHDPSSLVAKQWQTQQTPRAFLMDSKRNLLYRGAIDNFRYPEDPEYVSYLEPAIAQFMGGNPVARPEVTSYGCSIQSVYYNLPRVFTNAR